MQKSSTELQSILLDPNHSHFIIIDDDANGQYGKEMLFRTKLEAELRKHKNYTAAHWQELRRKNSNSSVNLQEMSDEMTAIEQEYINFSIPMILICVNGGYDAMKHINECLKQRIPILLLQVLDIFQLFQSYFLIQI
jgi:hypothetical protein